MSRGIELDNLMEFGVWIVTLIAAHPPGSMEGEEYVSEVPVCARDLKGAEEAARQWTLADDMVPGRVIQSRYVCGVKACSNIELYKRPRTKP
jgi:hypothetical protein